MLKMRSDIPLLHRYIWLVIKAANLVKRFYAKSINKSSSRYVFYVHKKAEKMKLGLVFSD